jgi:hypothetical protein
MHFCSIFRLVLVVWWVGEKEQNRCKQRGEKGRKMEV